MPRASGARTMAGHVAPAACTTTVVVAIEVAPGSAAGDMPQTPEGVAKDVLEESVPEVVPEEVPVEGAMIIVHVTAPSPPHGAA
jgi:hypothetical protein